MKHLSRTLAVALALAAAAATLAAAATYTSADGKIEVNASVIDLAPPRVIASGKAHIRSEDKAAGVTLDAKAQKIVATLRTGSADRSSLASAISTAELTGGVTFIYLSPDKDTGVMTRTTVTGDRATYSAADEIARLTGSVRVVNDNPAMFSTPAVMTGDTAILNLKKQLGPDEYRFRVESSPGVSRVEITPKNSEADKPK